MNKQIVNGAIGLGFAFIAFLGSQLYMANNDIVRLNQAMKLLVTEDLQIRPSPENALARGKLEALTRVNALTIDQLEERVKELKFELQKIELRIERLK
jgi:hypothetical protein